MFLILRWFKMVPVDGNPVVKRGLDFTKRYHNFKDEIHIIANTFEQLPKKFVRVMKFNKAELGKMTS